MSGYASMTEVRSVICATLVNEGRKVEDYNVSGIARDAFHYRGRMYGYGALPVGDWQRAVMSNRRRNRV